MVDRRFTLSFTLSFALSFAPSAVRSVARSVAFLLTMALTSALLPACSVTVPDGSRFVSERCAVRVDTAANVDALELVAILPMTTASGGEDAAGVARARAMELAVTEANSRQGVRGRTFRLRICDAGGSVDAPALVAAEIARAVVTGPRPPAALLTGGTDETLAVQAATQQQKTLVMSVSATSPDLTDADDGGLLWRVTPSDRVQGLVLSYLLAEAGAKQVVVLAQVNSYGDGLSVTLKKNPPAGAKVTIVAVQATDASIVKALTSAAALTPDHVVLISSAALGARLLNGFAAKPALAKAKLLLSDGLKRTDIFAQLKDANQLKGALGTTPGDPPGEVFDAFNARFKQLFGVDATQQSFTAHAYDATYCLTLAHAWALRTAAKQPLSGVTLAEGLQQLSLPTGVTVTLEPTAFADGRKELLAGRGVNVRGASGRLDFDNATGEPTSAVEVWQVADDSAAGGQAFVPQYWLQAEASGSWRKIPPPK